MSFIELFNIWFGKSDSDISKDDVGEGSRSKYSKAQITKAPGRANATKLVVDDGDLKQMLPLFPCLTHIKLFGDADEKPADTIQR